MKLETALAKFDAESRKAGHSRNTRKSYRGWVADYAARLKAGAVSDFQTYLDHLATVRRLHPKTIKQALCALAFFHKRVLGRDPGKLRFARPTRGSQRRMPACLSHAECMDLLARMERVPKLQASLLYGCGLRVTEAVTLRLKDIDLDGGMVTVHGGKGDKDRTVAIPNSILPALADQIERCRGQWRQDTAAGRICPTDRDSLMRKLGRATFASLPWYWLFPSRVVRGHERWHATTHGLSKALKAAAGEAGITKRVTAHGLRHSYATTLLRSCVDIRTIQVQLGHSRVETTEIYAHAASLRTAPSPLDAPTSPVVVPFRQPIRKQA